MSCNGVGKISCRRTRDRVESKDASLGEGNRDDTILEAQRGQANRVILDVEISRAHGRSTQLLSQTRSLKERSETDRQARLIALGEGQQFGVAPHIWGPLRNTLTGNRRFQGVVVISDFQGGETIVADGARLVSPRPSALAAPQFVMRHIATRFLSVLANS